jgi:pimeloyl-ACP methyl ester carboxylesterase
VAQVIATPRRFTRWLAFAGIAVAVAVAAGVAVDLATGGGLRGWLDRTAGGPYVGLGERIDVGGRSLYLDCRGSGSPTIVLEAGAGSDSGTWGAAFGSLASLTRTCAYDRAGLGRSDPRERHTLADAADDLARVLATAAERPPYILVAHSAGGLVARVFAAANRDQVEGVVLVESFDPDLQHDWVHPLLGDLRPEYDAELSSLRALVANVEALDWAASEAQLRAAVLTGMPIEFIVAPRYEPRLDQATNDAIAAAWTAARDSLSPGHVRQTTAFGAGHFVQIDRPAYVVDAVRRLLGR